MLVLSAHDVEHLLPPKKIIEAVRHGFIEEAEGKYEVPERMHIGDDEFMFLLMPAIGSSYFATKLVSVIPENRNKNLPVVSGTLTLNQRSTGETLAFMDATNITAIRTGAVGAIGLDYISDPSTDSIGILGCGVQGMWQTIMAANVRSIRTVYCFSRTKSTFNNYSDSVRAYCPQLELIWCADADQVVQKAQVIYGCTTSSSPVFSDSSDLVKDRVFISVGSFRKDMQELPDAVYKDADFLLIDSSAATHEVGDVVNAIRKEFFTKEEVIKIGDVLSGKVHIASESKKVFKSVGMAAFDLAVAIALYEYAVEKGSGQHVRM